VALAQAGAMITISTAQNKAVPASREQLTLLCMAGLVHYSIDRMRFEGISSRVTPYVLETFMKQLAGTPESRLTRETDR
jgi:hypothetical protein